MNQTPDNQIALEQEQNNIPEAQDNISMMLEKRRKMLSGEDISSNQDAREITENSQIKNPSPQKKQDEPQNNDSVDASVDSSNELQDKITKLNTKFEENQKYARDVSRKMSNIAKNLNQSVKELIENGDLTEEHGKFLLNVFDKNELKKPEGLTVDEEVKSDPFQKFYDIANPVEIQNYKAYTRDEEYLNKIMAFNALMNESSQEEKEEMYDIFNEISHNPPDLVSKMMEIGNKFLEEGYRDLIKAGSLRKYIQYQKQNRSNKEKEIDSLKKKTVKYDHDYDQPTYGFENGSIAPLKNDSPKNNSTQSPQDNAQRAIDRRDKMIREQNKLMSVNHINRR